VRLLPQEDADLVGGDDRGGGGATTVPGMELRPGGGGRPLVATLRARPGLADLTLAAAAVVIDLVLTSLAPPEVRPDSWAQMVVWSAACAAPMALRRVAPWVAVGAMVAVLAGSVLMGLYPFTHIMSYIVVTYTVAARLSLRPAILAWLALWLPVFAVNVADRESPNPSGLPPAFAVVYNLLAAMVLFLVGRTVQARRTATRVLEERARAAETNQRAMADRAVADERRRIARELHDVVAHHVSVMGVLATGARRVLRRTPDTADEALATIEETSRTALREMRRLLDVLRTDAEPAAELAPQPGLAGIETLVEQVNEAGLPVVLQVDGRPGPLDPGMALTIYRIVQEALTNALKHAGPATAEVRLRFGVYWLVVEVFDTGRGPSAGVVDGAAVGHGLVGMRERVALYGGSLRIGPRPGGGFRVYAKLPVDQLGGPVDEEVLP
jgi:signal transduction histidine kinase